LNDELGVREQLGEFGHDARNRVQVDLSGKQQHRRVDRGQCRASGLRVEGALSAEGGRGFLVPMAVLGRLVGLCRRIPSAVEEGLDGLPAVVVALPATIASSAAKAAANQGSSLRSRAV